MPQNEQYYEINKSSQFTINETEINVIYRNQRPRRINSREVWIISDGTSNSFPIIIFSLTAPRGTNIPGVLRDEQKAVHRTSLVDCWVRMVWMGWDINDSRWYVNCNYLGFFSLLNFFSVSSDYKGYMSNIRHLTQILHPVRFWFAFSKNVRWWFVRGGCVFRWKKEAEFFVGRKELKTIFKMLIMSWELVLTFPCLL